MRNLKHPTPFVTMPLESGPVDQTEQEFGEILLEGFDPLEELEKTLNDLMAAEEKIKVLESDDTTRELSKYVSLYQAMQSRLSQEMDKNARLGHGLRGVGKQHAAIRKLLGIGDDRQIVRAISQLVRLAGGQ